MFRKEQLDSPAFFYVRTLGIQRKQYPLLVGHVGFKQGLILAKTAKCQFEIKMQ